MADKFEQWAIVEIMGHQRFAGRVSEQAVGGANFVRVDVPKNDEVDAFTKLFGPSSIYCITLVTEEVARAAAQGLRNRPVHVYDIPQLRQQPLSLPDEAERDEEEIPY
jgi:hypothetical protein